MSLPPANWYPDPTAPGTERYWDGSAWGASTRAIPAPQAPIGQAFPPPTTPGPILAPKRSRRALWIILGSAGAIFIVALVAVGILALRTIAPNASAHYTGAPVTTEDVAPPGYFKVISDSETVAADIPELWIDATTIVDVSSVLASFPEGITMIGAWYTDDPRTDPSAQVVMLLEYPPALGSRGTLDDFQRGVVDGASRSPSTTYVGPTTAFTTDANLEGRRTAISYAFDGDIEANAVSAAVAHGRRVVILSWTAYNSSPDEAGIVALLESLRVDS